MKWSRTDFNHLGMIKDYVECRQQAKMLEMLKEWRYLYWVL